MDITFAQNALQKSRRMNRVLLGALCLLAASNVILVMVSMRQVQHQPRILVPMGLTRSVQVGGASVDAHYLSELARLILNLRLSVTPETIAQNQAALLHYVSPRFHAPLQALLRVEAKSIVKQNVSAVFYAKNIEPRPNALSVHVKGTLKRWLDGVRLTPIKKHYQLQFMRTANGLLLKTFIEAKKEG